MNDRKKRNILIGSLLCLLVFMMVGYAILSQTLNITGIANMKGVWDVKIISMQRLDDNTTGRAEEVSHSFTDTTATFEANLYIPGDSIEYRVTVKNNGNIDALLKTIIPKTTNKSANVKFTHSNIDNTILTAGKEITFTMKMEFDKNATSIPSFKTISYSLELNYIQYGGGAYTPALETAEDSCFMIGNDGTLYSYDKSCGVDVVVPAKVDDIPVKKIAPYFLVSNGQLTGETKSGSTVLIFQNQDKSDQYFEYINSTGEYSQTEINNLKASSYIYKSDDYNSLDLKTIKETASKDYFKISKDSSNVIKLEDATASDYNIIQTESSSIFGGSYCANLETSEMLKEYLRLKDPAREYGVTNSEYYEYLTYNFLSSSDSGVSFCYQMVDELDSLYLFGEGVIDFNVHINTVDLSQAAYLTHIDGYAMVQMNFETDKEVFLKQLTLPPNLEVVTTYTGFAEKVVFPKNSITKVIGWGGIMGEVESLPSTLKAISNGNQISNKSITIPSSVVRMGYDIFTSLESVTFENNSNLIAMYGLGEGYDYPQGTFRKNNLTKVVIPSSVKYIGDEVFYQNKLTNVSFASGSNLKHIGYNAFGHNQLTNTGLGKLPSTLTSLNTRAFVGNDSLTQITLTSPADLTGWPSGGTVDGKTVVYDR